MEEVAENRVRLAGALVRRRGARGWLPRGEINDGAIVKQFVLLCETLPEDGMMRWFDPRAMESMDFDYDMYVEDGEGKIYGEPFEVPDWAA